MQLSELLEGESQTITMMGADAFHSAAVFAGWIVSQVRCFMTSEVVIGHAASASWKAASPELTCLWPWWKVPHDGSDTPVVWILLTEDSLSALMPGCFLC